MLEAASRLPPKNTTTGNIISSDTNCKRGSVAFPHLNSPMNWIFQLLKQQERRFSALISQQRTTALTILSSKSKTNDASRACFHTIRLPDKPCVLRLTLWRSLRGPASTESNSSMKVFIVPPENDGIMSAMTSVALQKLLKVTLSEMAHVVL